MKVNFHEVFDLDTVVEDLVDANALITEPVECFWPTYRQTLMFKIMPHGDKHRASLEARNKQNSLSTRYMIEQEQVI